MFELRSPQASFISKRFVGFNLASAERGINQPAFMPMTEIEYRR